MAIINECVGGGHEFVHDGKTYKIRLIDQGVKAEFERKFLQRAKDAAKELKEMMTSSEYIALLKQLNDDFIAGEYSIESPRAQKFLGTAAGTLSLLSILMGVSEMEVLRIFPAKKEEIEVLLELVAKESFPNFMKGDQAEADTKSEGQSG